MSDHVLVRREGAVIHMQLNRLDKRNALTQAMYAAMNAVLSDAAADERCRVVVLSGNESCFTAGNDVKDFMAGGVSAESPVAQFLHEISHFPKPLIAAAAGPAIGVGTTLLFHCDLVYATDDLQLRTPFVDLALVPEAASSLLMPAALGYQRAAAMLMLGESMTAHDAHTVGLVNQVVPAGTLLDTAMDKARNLASKPPAALRATKALMRQADQHAVESRMKQEGALFFERLQSPEAMEAFSAFLEQRAPDFSKFA